MEFTGPDTQQKTYHQLQLLDKTNTIVRKQPTLGQRQLPLAQVTTNKSNPCHSASPGKNCIRQDCKIKFLKTR